MKRYRTYMNEIKATDTLRQRLRALKTSAKRPVPWKKYGVVAAALALVFGLGGVAGYAYYYNTVVNPTGQPFLDRTQDDPNYPEHVPVPDIAPGDPDETVRPENRTLGSYEYRDVRGGVDVTVFCILPYIEYGEVGRVNTMADWDIPEGAVRRDLPRDEIIALMGGEDAVNTHLDWGRYELTGWAAWCEDGTFWGAYINGRRMEWSDASDTFEFAVTAYQLPPTCFVYPSSVTQEVRGLTITADKYDWERYGESLTWVPERRVSFFKGDLGCRFVVSSYDTEQAELLVSRLVCRIADEGLGEDLIEAYAQMRGSVCKTCGEEIIPGTRHFHGPIYTCPACGQSMPQDDMLAHIHAFHSKAADSGETKVCPICEQVLPLGEGHGRAPERYYTCSICGKDFPIEHAGHDSYLRSDKVYGCANCHIADQEDNAPPVSVSDEPYVCAGYPVPDPAESGEVRGYPPAISNPAIVTLPADDSAYESGVPDPDLTGSGGLCGLPLAPEGWNGP